MRRLEKSYNPNDINNTIKEEFLSLMEEEIITKVISLPEGDNAREFLNKMTPEQLQDLLQNFIEEKIKEIYSAPEKAEQDCQQIDDLKNASINQEGYEYKKAARAAVIEFYRKVLGLALMPETHREKRSLIFGPGLFKMNVTKSDALRQDMIHVMNQKPTQFLG